MTKRLRDLITGAQTIRATIAQDAEAGSFAHKLAMSSLSSHVDELEQLRRASEEQPIFELIEFRLMASRFRFGSVPLHVIAQAAEEIRQMIGHAALRLVQGGLRRKRVPDSVYDNLDLRLAGILPGSSRLLITSVAHRDLFDNGLSKSALERIFGVLASGGKGEQFLEAITDLGPASSRKLRDFLQLLKKNSAEIEVSWRYSGQMVNRWEGSVKAISEVSSALTVTELIDRDAVVLEGIVELLSKRERIHVRTTSGPVVRVLFPIRLLDEVAKLHLDQRVKLECQVTETENPLTKESSIFYELLKILP